MAYAEIQSKTGSFIGTSGTASFDAGTTAGMTVIMVIGGVDTPGINTPTGFSRDTPTNGVTGAVNVVICHKSNVGAGENSWSITMTAGTAKPVSWWLLECDGIDLVNPVDFWQGDNLAQANTDAMNGSGFIPAHIGNLAVSGFCGYTTNATPPTMDLIAGGFTEVAEQSVTNGSTLSADLMVATQEVRQVTNVAYPTAQASATCAWLASGSVVYCLAGARVVPDMYDCNGFEYGPVSGVTAGATGSAALAPLYAATGTYAIEAAAARTGSYGCRVYATSGISRVQPQRITLWGTTPDHNAFTVRFSFRFRSSLPSNDVQIFSLGLAQIWFRQSTGKLGAVISGGSEVASDATVSSGHWIGIDLRYETATTSYKLDWRIDYNADLTDMTAPVDQTRATFTAGATSITADPYLGWQSNTTATVDYDDYGSSIWWYNYPLGDLRVRAMPVNTTVSATNGGLAPLLSQFALITNNNTGSTLTAGNINTARNNIAEIPVTVGSSANGLCQVTAGSGNYIEVTMAPPNTVALGEAPRFVKMYVCGWAATSSTNSFWIAAGYGDVGETVLLNYDVAPSFGTTTGVWVCGLVGQIGGALRWDQTELSRVKCRMGNSTDAAPDVGVLGAMCEVACEGGNLRALAGDIAVALEDPVTEGVLNVTVNAPTGGGGQDTTVYYETDGTPTTYTVTAGTQDVREIGAPDDPAINYIAVYPPSEV